MSLSYGVAISSDALGRSYDFSIGEFLPASFLRVEAVFLVFFNLCSPIGSLVYRQSGLGFMAVIMPSVPSVR